ncbi:MAG: hypothetical protein CVU00_06030 [Bacteroidetes bacterium HGW-Bacteroidetes-17]|jgi:putative ABC transport system permease protein|nr:MAG: hypothetical protein CVU00_06030 [Bacteroidetes bacterium HGW-Bacteroidetes-17]
MNNYYLKYAIRNIFRQKLYSFINIFGLAIGICIFLLIGMYALYEYNYDKFNKRYDEKYGLIFGESPILPAGIGHLLANSIPEIEKTCRTTNLGQATISFSPSNDAELGHNLNINIRQYVDSTIFDIFTLEFKYGNAANALKDPMSCVLSDEVSEKLFGKENPINKVIKIRNTSYRIDGVVIRPEKSHFQFDALLSLQTLSNIYGKEYLAELNSYNYLTYLLLNGHYDSKKISNKIYHYLDNYDHDIFKKYGTNQFESEDFVSLRSLSEIYFSKDEEFTSMFAGIKHGNKQMINVFMIIAIFILFIAIINFINLSTATASTRTKEISIKKIVGAPNLSLKLQFLLESIIIALFAMLIALTLLQRILPEFNNYFAKTIDLSQIFSTTGLAIILLFTLFLGIISGLYPAVYLSQTKLSKLLTDSKNRNSNSFLFRRILILFQFTITSSLIAGTIIISLQNNYMQNKDLGFKKEHIINLLLPTKIVNSRNEFKAELLKIPYITNVSFSHGIPGNTYNTVSFKWKDTEETMRITTVDPDFFDLYQIKIKEGRFFNPDLQTDKINTCLINETAAKLLGWDTIVGEYIKVNKAGSIVPDDFTIIGIFKDYHVESLHNSIVPMAIFWNEQFHRQASIKFNEKYLPTVIPHIEKSWKIFAPESPFEYSLLINRLNDQYTNEEKLYSILFYLSLLIIFIACLGLFGLASFMVFQKTKEIGIRKVYGASVSSIVLQLCKEYSALIIIASIVSVPVVIYFLDIWLSRFSYRINIPWWVFLVSSISSLIIANITVYFHSIKAAYKNPIDAIRYE